MDKIIEVSDPRVISTPSGVKKPGPPNRMNDLTYTEWMKFQKSFFKYTSTQEITLKCIEFFTKEKWREGQPSKTLLIDIEVPTNILPKDERIIHIVKRADTFKGILKTLEEATKAEMKYDFIFINLSRVVSDIKKYDEFIEKYSDSFFKMLRQSLNPGRYCSITIDEDLQRTGSFPIAWGIASVARKYLKVRDEKIGLRDELLPIQYSMFFQADFDNRPSDCLTSRDLNYLEAGKPNPSVSWLIPKPPPRKKNEILHPAKFPETLVENFISDFTKEGESVYDPMAGTGSSVLAARSLGRMGFGTDLSNDFVKISNDRLANAGFEPTVFAADARNLKKCKQIANKEFEYIVTSPPYWSMLKNKGSENQRNRKAKDLPLIYSESEHDLGNIDDYDDFLSDLVEIYMHLSASIKLKGHLTIVVKNIKRNHTVYPLAYDLIRCLAAKKAKYKYVGCTFWCQDDIGMKPFAVGTHWVSNIVHQYCLHFQRVL